MSTNVEATAAEIDLLRVGDLAPGLAQLALTLAASMDERGGATSKANAGRELRTALAELRKLAPVAADNDRVDELLTRRRRRRDRAS